MSSKSSDGPWTTYRGHGKKKASSSGTKKEEYKKPESFKEALKEPITLGLKQTLIMALLNPTDSEDDYSEEENINEIYSESSSFSGSQSDHDCQCKTQTDYYKAILETNGLSINVFTKEEQSILDLIDQFGYDMSIPYTKRWVY